MKRMTYLSSWQSAALALCLGLGLAVSACGEDDGNIATAGGGTLVVTPDPTIIFSEVGINQTATQTFTMTNAGDNTLRVDGVKLQEDSADTVREIIPGPDWVDKVDLEPGDSRTLSVQWTPLNSRADGATITIDSSDPNLTDGKVIYVETPNLLPRISSPRQVQFPRVAPGTTKKTLHPIQNVGFAPLQIDDIFLNPMTNTEFSITVPSPGAPEDESQDIALEQWTGATLEPEEIMYVRISFTPTSDAPKSAEMLISSNDPEVEIYKVDLTGNSGSACIQLSLGPPSDASSSALYEVNFGDSQIGVSTDRTVQIENCSRSKELEITGIDFQAGEDGDGTFEISTLPGELGSGTPLSIGPLETETFVVSFTPTDDTLKKGRIVVSNTDPVNATLDVDLLGKGTNNVCPIAVAEATVIGSMGRPAGQIATIPLKTIQLSGQNSSDPNGSVDRYEWNIVRKPVNSTARLTPNNTVPDPKLFLDLSGEYELELTVYDDQGLASCETATVKIQATPDEDIHIQLVWDTPADSVDDDRGTDIDLHYLHPLGRWDQAPYDIFWRNKEADWGIDGNSSDNPSLDIDDTDGSGPENVNHDNPESGRTYTVGVYYYNDNGYGASYATLRIYVEGQLKFELRDKYLEKENDFWEVASIVWPSKQIIARDRVRDGFP